MTHVITSLHPTKNKKKMKAVMKVQISYHTIIFQNFKIMEQLYSYGMDEGRQAINEKFQCLRQSLISCQGRW